VSAQQGEKSDSRYYVAPMGALAISQRDDTHDVAVGGTLAVGTSWLPHLGLEVIGDYLRYNHAQHVGGIGLGANVYWLPDHRGIFVHADIEGGNHAMYNAGLGFVRPMADGAVSLRLEALWHKRDEDDAEPMFRFGLQLPFGHANGPAPMMAVQPVEVVPLDQMDPASGSETPDEVSDAAEVIPVPVEKSVPADAQDATPAAIVEPSTAQAAAAPRPTAHRPRKTESPTKSQADVGAKETIPEPSPAAAILEADTGPRLVGDAVADEPVVSVPDELSADDGALAQTEPAPAPRGAIAAPAAEAEDTAAATQDQPEIPDESGLAPTEPAPKP
jgi:hypothetical protein